ncbi:fumarylacetoacetate hydrolase family protein [Pseudonocardia sp. RS11V-5]|uniref:2-keto-4-pentenoate hydratase n=1 Tax=Pseudonocardia terrae TaxID=2905831 RepID=UPI001E3BB241|nr:fumarylacetoacetate hydrolase family protein [Pseudonocardia terrae]MCE3550714.1 fumarylacetoacetate hydrolase family protein [Pseudonocardia terrae]
MRDLDATVATEQVAELVWKTWQAEARIAALPERIRPRTADEGWAAQQRLGSLVGPSYGWKIAATSSAGQAHIGVSGPLPGLLFDRFRFEPGAVLPSDGLHMRVVEAEFAFRMGRDVPAVASAGELADAVSDLHLAVEVPDSRFERFEAVGEPSLLADSACAGYYVLGPAVTGWRDADLAACRTRVEINGEVAAEGRGEAVLGSPRLALAWLAAELARLGRGLRAGEIVSTGTTTTPPTIGPGDEVRAAFEGFGEVTLAFAR